MSNDGIYLVEPVIRWRELFEIKIPNDNLKRRVETFLDVLEKSAFRYDFLDAASGVVEDRYLSGQDILRRIADVRKNIGLWLKEHEGSRIAEFLATTSVIKNGKFFISQHNRPFNGNITNGTQTMFVGNPDIGAYPLGFEIGTDYLKGVKYQGVDKKLHPVTVDAAVVHELTHIAYNTANEDIPIMVEGIVASALGAVQRDDVHGVAYKKDVNGGFWLLSHKVKSGGALKSEFEARVISDFDRTVHPSGYDYTEAMAYTTVFPTVK